MRRCRLLCWLLVFGGGAVALGQNADLKRLQEQARKQQEQYLNRVRLFPGTFRMDQVLRVAQEDGQLVVRCGLPNLPVGESRLNVEGVRGTTIVSLGGRVDAQGRVPHINVRNHDFDSPDAIQIDTNINASNGHFNLSRSRRMPAGYQSISLQQSMVAVMPGAVARRVIFNVNKSDASGRMPQNISLSADDFPTLRQRHARELEEHLRPLLRELQLDSLLAVDPMTAWQVFVDEWRPDPNLRQRISALLPQLDADDFRQREAALQQLQESGRDGVLVVRQIDRKPLTAQQNMLLDTYLSGFQPVSASEARRLLTDQQFLLDCLYSEDRPIRAAALKRLQTQSQVRLDFDLALEAQQRPAAVDRVRAQLAGKPVPPLPTTRPR